MTSAGFAPSGPHELKAYYLDIFRRNRRAILEAANLGLDASIKGCPGWDVASLTGHMGRVYTFWLKWVRERPREMSEEAYAEIASERDSRLTGYTDWDRAGFPKRSRPKGGAIIDFARRAGDELDTALVHLSPTETVWTFVSTDRTGAFVFRRLAMETSIHRWDAEEAHSVSRPFDGALARDGIDEMLKLFRDDPAYEENQHNRQGQRILLREHRGSGRWRVCFDSNGITVSSDEGPADTTVSGTFSDLWLFIMGRRAPEEMKVEGDVDLAARWGELAGRF